MYKIYSFLAFSSVLLGFQPPTIVTPSYRLPASFSVAPGQLITLITHGITLDPASDTVITRAPSNANLPDTLAGISATYAQPVPYSAPILEVHPFWTCSEQVVLFRVACGSLAAVTIQIPFEAQFASPAPGASLYILQNGASVASDVDVMGDQIHILTVCDAFMNPGTFFAQGYPCGQSVAHADGTLVSATNPAKGGEELVAYAVGLGQTTPASITGQLVTRSSPTVTTFNVDYNFRANALPTRPLASGPLAIYAGSTPGYVGLYQLNFTVPAIPAGTSPCVDTTNLASLYNVVESNLTVSFGGNFSFDGARICVAVK